MHSLLSFAALSCLTVACTERGREARATEPRVVSSGAGVEPSQRAPALPASAAASAPRDADVWASPEACQRAVALGARLPRPKDKVRVGTWNIRWFPDGKPGNRPAAVGTNVAWLACTLAWLDVDALSVQEFKGTPWAREQAQVLLTTLDELTGGSWQLRLDDCDRRSSQHVGVLWRGDRLRAGKALVLAELNPHAEACKDQLRPGLALSLTRPSGIDFTLVSVHAKSGTKARDLGLRQKSAARLVGVVERLAREFDDRDVIFAGDFNTMGCPGCTPEVSAPDELASLDRLLGAAARRVSTKPDCSLAYRGRASSLDHLVVRLDAAELAAPATAVASGYCGQQDCDFDAPPSAAQQRLSDHCPVLLDLTDVDADPVPSGPASE